jgi:streptogramin lyase
MLDPKTGKITEYKMPTPMSKAYSTNVDRRTGLVWSAEFLADRFNVIDPKTGEMRDYLLPSRDSQVRIISNYSVGDHTVLFFGVMGKYGGGKIGKLEAW